MKTIGKRSLRVALMLAVGFGLQVLALGQSGPASYHVILDKNPSTHFAHIAVQVSRGSATSVDVAMPAWSPGSYNIHNAWRNVQEFSATDESGAPLKFEKIDKQTWRVYCGSGRTITARYKLYHRNYNDELCYITG